MPSSDLRLNFPQPLLSLTQSCETNCVAGCCGLDAFDVASASIAAWIAEEGADKTRQALDQFEDLLIQIRGHQGILHADAFNAWWKGSKDCMKYFQTWQKEILAAVVAKETLPIDPRWLNANEGLVRNIAQQICQEQSGGLLPALADALEDAGCGNEALLSHARESREHGPACWLVELLLATS